MPSGAGPSHFVGDSTVPFKSQAQRRKLWATNPRLAKKFERHTPKGKKLPKRVRRRRARRRRR